MGFLQKISASKLDAAFAKGIAAVSKLERFSHVVIDAYGYMHAHDEDESIPGVPIGNVGHPDDVPFLKPGDTPFAHSAPSAAQFQAAVAQETARQLQALLGANPNLGVVRDIQARLGLGTDAPPAAAQESAAAPAVA